MSVETTSTLSVHLPGSSGYREATTVYDLFAPVQPDEAVIADSVGLVAAAIARARSRGLDVEVISTGHASSMADQMSGALLVRTVPSGPVEVDPQARRARIPAGTRWGTVAEAAARYGLAAMHGSSPDVGAVGYLLRGGLSFYGRRFGLAVNSVRAVELVAADGQLHRVDTDHDPSLFWAVRGGGGGFGVVTAVEIELFDASAVWTGADWWPVSEAGPLLEAWAGWTRTAPREVTTSFRIMRLPPLPSVPEPLTRGPVVCLDGVALATTSAEVPGVSVNVDELLGRMRAVAKPLLATWRAATTLDVPQTHMDPPDPLPAVGDHMVLGDLDEDGQQAFLSTADAASQSPLIFSELRQLGGALADAVADGGAVNHLKGAYCYYALAVPADERQAAAMRRYLTRARAALAPWDTGSVVPNFVEDRDNPGRWMDEERAAFVDLVRRGIDPDGLFRRGVWPPRQPSMVSSLKGDAHD
jgi:FAD binding domain